MTARLTRKLQREIVAQIRGGATFAHAVFAVRAERWRQGTEWLDATTVYRWIQRARKGIGTVAEIEFLNAVTAAEVDRNQALTAALAEDIAGLSQRVRLLESALNELAGVDVAAEAASLGVHRRCRR